MAKYKLRVCAPDPIQDAHEVVELCAKTFGPYYDFRRHLREWYLLNGPYDWQASAVGFMDGQMVTHFGVWDYQMRIGRSAVRCGGIGCVATDGEYRKKGLMAQTAPPSIKAMALRGYDMSVLFGVWGFYHRFGYVRAWNEMTWNLDRGALPPDLPKVKYVATTELPTEAIAKLHNKHNATVTGSAVRPMFTHGYTFFHGKPAIYVWPNDKKPVGHVMVQVDGGRLRCYEATGKPDEVLAVLKGLAEEKQLKELSFATLPYASSLARRLRTLNARLETQYVKSGSAMVRLINLQSTLEKLRPTFEARLRESELADYSGSLTLKSADETATLAIAKGQVQLSEQANGNVIAGGFALAQLLLGTDDPMELAESHKMRLGGEAGRLAKVLFPNEYPQLHQADRY